MIEQFVGTPVRFCLHHLYSFTSIPTSNIRGWQELLLGALFYIPYTHALSLPYLTVYQQPV